MNTEKSFGLFGQIIASDLTLINPANKSEKINIKGVLMSVDMVKEVEYIKVLGIDGTIKPYINEGDFNVKIRGWFTTDNAHDYPIEATRMLIKLLKLKTSLKAVSDLLLTFNVFNLVVLSFHFFQVEGVQNTQFFEIETVSDYEPIPFS